MTRTGVAVAALLLALPSGASAQAGGRDVGACAQRALVYIEAHRAATMRYLQLLSTDPGGAAHMSPNTCAALRQAIAAGNDFVRWANRRKGGCAGNNPAADASTRSFAAGLRPLVLRHQRTCGSR